MDKTAEPASAPEKEDNPHFINRMIKIVAYPVSAAAGFLVAHTSIRSSSYKTAASAKAFEDIDQKFHSQAQSNVAQRLSGAINSEEYLAKAAQTKHCHSAAVQTRVEELGLKKFSKKWNYVNRANKQAAIIEGLSVSGIAIGALLTIANSKSLTDLFAGESKDSETKR